MSQLPPRGPPPEEPTVPIEQDVAAARSKFIKTMIEKVKSLKALGKSPKEIKDAVPEFTMNYPALIKMLLAESYNEGSLRTVVAMLEQMGTGNMTQHQASVVVGQRLHDVYIKPKINEEH